MPPYAPATHQLVLEIYVSSIPRSIAFYTSLGFTLQWQVKEYFAQLAWIENNNEPENGGCLLFLKTNAGQPRGNDSQTSSVGVGNIRIMVPDVDAKYAQCKNLDYEIELELDDRKFVVRDFIVRDPDGFGVRFGSFLPGRGRGEQEGPEDEIVIRGPHF